MSLPPTTASAPVRLTVGGAHAALPPVAAAPLLPALALAPPLLVPPLLVPPAPATSFAAPALGVPAPDVPPLAVPPLPRAPLTPVTPPVIGWLVAPAWLGAPPAKGVVPGALCEQLTAENRQSTPGKAEIEP